MVRSIFNCDEQMPPTANSPDVVRTAMSPGDVVNVTLTEGGMRRSRAAPQSLHDVQMDVQNINRPVRGRPY